MKDELTTSLENMLRTEWVRISEHMTQFSKRDEMWYELVLKHEGADIDPQTESHDMDGYCYPESPHREGNVVRMPRETALKIIALGFQ